MRLTAFFERVPSKFRDNVFEISLEFAYLEADIDSDDDQQASQLGTITYDVEWGGQVVGPDNSFLNIVRSDVHPQHAPSFPVVTPQGNGRFNVKRLGLRALIENSGQGSADMFNPGDIATA